MSLESRIERLEKIVEELKESNRDIAGEMEEWLEDNFHDTIAGAAEGNIRKIKKTEFYLEYPHDEHRSPHTVVGANKRDLPSGWNMDVIWFQKYQTTISFKHDDHYAYQDSE